MLRMMLPALRPQQKSSRCAEDTLALMIEQWVIDQVIDAKAALRESGGGEKPSPRTSPPSPSPSPPVSAEKEESFDECVL